MSGESIFDLLHAAEIDQTELENVLSVHFKGAMAISAIEIFYPGHESKFALKLIYNKRGTLKEIISGPLLTTDDIQSLKKHIEEEILESVRKVLDSQKLENGMFKGYVANLGHGIFPDIPVEGARAFIRAVKQYES